MFIAYDLLSYLILNVSRIIEIPNFHIKSECMWIGFKKKKTIFQECINKVKLNTIGNQYITFKNSILTSDLKN